VRAHQRFPLAAAGLPAISTTNLSRQCINTVTALPVSGPAPDTSFESLPGSSFTVNGAAIPKDPALTSVGGQLFFAANWSAAGSQSYAGSGTLRQTG
jgi:hypothetical protein